LVSTTKHGRMKIALRLKKKLDWLPDPDVDIDASFGLQVVQGGPQLSFSGLPPLTVWWSLHHHLEPADVAISTDLSFPRWAWLVPGLGAFLTQARLQGEQAARESATAMVAEAVQQLLDPWFGLPFIGGPKPPPKSDKHAAWFFVDPVHGGMLATTFCPELPPFPAHLP
jgi:hypothetical protein